MSDAPPTGPIRPFHLAALGWGFAEATLFFMVPDIMLGWIAVRRGLRAAAIAALFAAVGAMVGAAVIYQWSAVNLPQATAVIEALPAIPAGAVDRAGAAMGGEPWILAAIKGSVTNEPFKLFAAAAPRAGISMPAFVAATPLIRLPRFLVNGLVFALAGAALRRAGVSERNIGIVYALGWALFYAAFWALSPW